VDAQLVGGAVLFGMAGGLVGYCPGPALASLGFGNWRTLLFTAAMLVGIGGFQVLHRASIVPTLRLTITKGSLPARRSCALATDVCDATHGCDVTKAD
jgi:uncharacterized membrane protein YedE/YeeE